MTFRRGDGRDAAVAALQEHGLLVVTDRAFPNVAAIVAGEIISGSWWAHPMAHEIFAVDQSLESRDDVVLLKLLSGKNTFVERSLWGDLLCVCLSREVWQTSSLSALALELHKRCDDGDIVRAKNPDEGRALKELEKALLVHVEQIHAESGRHVSQAMSWTSWMRRREITPSMKSAQEAKASMSELVAALNRRFGANAALPWPRNSV